MTEELPRLRRARDLMDREYASRPTTSTTRSTPHTARQVCTNFYYRATFGSGYAECDLRPEWANLPCRVQPGGQPGTGPELPVTTTTYDMFNQPRLVTEKTPAGVLRSTTNSYDAAGRSYETAVNAAAGLGTALPTQRRVYDTYTARLTRTQTVAEAVTAEVVRDYDSLGRQTSYTGADATTATTSYDLMSRPVARVVTQRAGEGFYPTQGLGGYPCGTGSATSTARATSGDRAPVLPVRLCA